MRQLTTWGRESLKDGAGAVAIVLDCSTEGRCLTAKWRVTLEGKRHIGGEHSSADALPAVFGHSPAPINITIKVTMKGLAGRVEVKDVDSRYNHRRRLRSVAAADATRPHEGPEACSESRRGMEGVLTDED